MLREVTHLSGVFSTQFADWNSQSSSVNGCFVSRIAKRQGRLLVSPSFLAQLEDLLTHSEHETRLTSWISDIVEEGRTSGDEDLWSRPTVPSNCAYLAFAVVKLWARLIRGNEQWAILKIIGQGLDIYANTCEEIFVNSLVNE